MDGCPCKINIDTFEYFFISLFLFLSYFFPCFSFKAVLSHSLYFSHDLEGEKKMPATTQKVVFHIISIT
jgi:hypothetical protein